VTEKWNNFNRYCTGVHKNIYVTSLFSGKGMRFHPKQIVYRPKVVCDYFSGVL
jgi:hypothetical protein